MSTSQTLSDSAALFHAAWMALVVFVAFDLTVDDNLSVIKSRVKSLTGEQIASAGDSEGRTYASLPVSPPGAWTEDEGSEHLLMGLDSESASEGSAVRVSSPGTWSGRFAGILPGDAESNCWSTYEVSLLLQEDGDAVTANGSYVAEPASCSVHRGHAIRFVEATGLRDHNSLALEIRDSDTDSLLLVYSGVMMPHSLAGWFYLPSGKAVSGPTVLRRN